MGTILKYVFYAFLLIIVVLFAKNFLSGNITENTTVGEAVNQVKSDAADLASGAANKTSELMDASKETVSQQTSENYSKQNVEKNVKGEFKMSENKASDAWEATKEGTAKAWDKTKDVSSDAWEATKDGASKAGDTIADKSSDAWEATKEGTAKAWDSVKESGNNASNSDNRVSY